MKKTLTIMVLVIAVGAVGWTLYDFIGEDDNPQVDDSGGVTITSPSPEDNESNGSSSGGAPQKGEIAPDFELETLDGEKAQLSDYEGERVIVNFWATWCPPCRKEIPHFNKLYDKKDVEILAINVTETETNEDDVVDFVDEYDMTFPVLFDRESDVANEYKVPAYPTSYMIDSEGEISSVVMQAMEYDQMVDLVDDMD